MATQETIKQLFSGGVLRDIEDADARQAITALQNALNALTSGDTTTAIENFQEVIDFLDGVTDDETLIGKITALQTAINGKQPMLTFDNAPTAGSNNPVKSGGVKTALDAKADSSNVYPKSQTYTKTEVDDAIDDALDGFTPADVPTKVSDLTNDAGYQTQQQVAAAISQAAIEAVVGSGDFAMTYDAVNHIYNIVRLVPTITVSDESLAFDSTSKVKTITISGHNLKADIAITAPSGWTASVNSLAQVDGVVAETQVTLTYGGDDASTATGDLVLTAGTATASVPLSYTQYGGPTITVSDDSLEFEAIGGQTDTDTVTVGLFNITGNVSVNVGGGASSKFSASLSGNTLTITYTPGSVNSGTHTDTITLSAVEDGETISKAIAVTGTVLEQSLTITPSSLSLQSDNNVAATGTINVKGQNITGNVSLSVSGSGFTLSENTLAAADVNSANGVDVTVTATIASGDTASATISASSGFASASISAEWNITEVDPAQNDVVTRGGLKYKVTAVATTNTDSASDTDGAVKLINMLETEVYSAALQNDGNYDITSLSVPDTITINQKHYKVTGIAAYAFAYCTGLTSIFTGNNVTSVGNNAFQNVTQLTTLTFGSKLASCGGNMFNQNLPNITSIVIPDTVAIGNANQTILTVNNATTVVIGSGISSIVYKIKIRDVESLTLRYNGVVANTATNLSALTKSAINLYVPSDKIAEYKADSVWGDYVYEEGESADGKKIKIQSIPN